MPLKKKKKSAVKKRVHKKPVARKKILKKGPVKKKLITKKKVTKKAVLPREKGKLIGTITHYFPQVQAGVIKLKAPLAIGDSIKIKGHTTDFTQNVTSLQINRVSINSAKKGQEIGLQVESRVRRNDKVYKV